MSTYFSNSDEIRQSKLNEGIKSLKSRIKNVDFEPQIEVQEAVKAEPKYSKVEIADQMYDLYRSKVAPTQPEEEELVVANTHAMRANTKALMRSLADMRNGGAAGPVTEFTPQANGDVNPGRHCNYGAMIVAGTEMTLEDYKEEVETRMEACWKGYTAKGMKKKGGKMVPNCVKEEAEVENFDEPVEKQLLQEKDSEAVAELKEKLLELDDTSWQSIDKVMRVLAKEHKITPKQLHKNFKSENDGQIPDEWIKENSVMEEAGFMPLDEAVALNKVGNVYEVTGMWHAHTRRIKFMVPIIGQPSKDDMQKYFEMFYPGGKLISFYPSMYAGDNMHNEMIVVVPMKEEWTELEQQSWVQMTEEESFLYEQIITEEGEPTSPPMITDDGKIELWVADHDTGEEKVVIFEGKGEKDACYHKVKSRYKVWPSAYASGALVKCRQKGADSWGSKSKKEEYEYVSEGEAWTRKEGQNEKGGLNEKGRKSYERANPGSDLKAPSKKVGNPRRKSFCARMKGMRKRQKPSNNTGDDRLSKSLRAWNC